MQIIENYIASKQKEFSSHPLFEHLRKRLPLQETMGFAPYMAFWVMTFQDALRLNESLTNDPKLKEFAMNHKHEDAGHEKWFLQDIDFLFDISNLGIEWLYSPSCAAVRDGAYMIMAELIKAESDLLRISLLLALESTSQVFSIVITEYVCDMGYSEKLKYFSKTHHEAENEHALYEEGEHTLHDLKFTPQEREKAIALIDHIYQIFYTMADSIMKYIKDDRSLKYSQNALSLESEALR